MTSPDSFVFLNEPGTLRGSKSWNDSARAKLWLYNLHYFQDLTAEDAANREDWHRGLIARWIKENPAPIGNGWEPYPISLRIVNWVKWSLAGHELEATALNSLAAQARHLGRRIEWHLLGNHLLANAKALLFAGAFFSGAEAEEWLRQGSAIYRQELDEQILADGGHFERSPMYHAIVLEDLLDLTNLASAYCGLWGEELTARFCSVAVSMRRWLRQMSHPDGDIAFFNDAAFGIAARPLELEAYAERLGLEALGWPGAVDVGAVHLSASGYVRFEHGKAVALVDTAPIGPDYLPGHAHADTLSFELSIETERVIVNGGTSVYGTGSQRQRERSTAAHSTVEIDGESSSEVWGGFRVARRARVLDVQVTSGGSDWIKVSASHDGYRRLKGRNTHERCWLLEEHRLMVQDRVSGPYRAAIARFHLGPDVTLVLGEDRRAGILKTRRGRKIAWRTNAVATKEASEWRPRFGVRIPTECLAISLESDALETSFSW